MIQALIIELNEYVDHFEEQNTAVSHSTVGWQIDHALRSMCTIGKALIKSDPEQFKRTLKWKWIMVGGLQYIPRGKGKAPKVAVNEGTIAKPEIETLLNDAQSIWQRVEGLNNKAFFTHPYFGNLPKRQAKKFVRIHTRHHLKIIKDILK